MKKLITYICLCLLSLPALRLHAQEAISTIDYGTPKEYTIGGVTISGTNYLDKAVLVSISGLRPGQKVNIPGEDISIAIKNLWDQKLFTKVSIVISRVVGNEVFLDIQVEERPRLGRFNFKGIRGGEVDELRKKLSLTAGSIVTENTKFTVTRIIKDYYHDKGFLNCKVKLQELRDTMFALNTVTLTIMIDKGEKVRINAINFYGNHAFDDNKVRRQMKDTKEKFKMDLGKILSTKSRQDPRKWNFLRALATISPMALYEYFDRYTNLNLFKSSKFDKNAYSKDKEKIIALYNNAGYRDAKILKDTTYMVGENDMNIDIYVEEGRQYYLRNIYWKGNQKYNDSTLQYYFQLKRGSIYSQGAIDEKLFMSQSGNDVSSLYMDDGYLFFQVAPAEIMVEGDSIDLEMRIFEGAQATINQVKITGNTKTNEHVIRRELHVVPGNKFSRSDLIRSQRDIAQLGYFDPEQIEIIPTPNPATGTVDVEFKVVEKPSDQLELSAGWGGSGRGIVGTAGVSFTNFSLKNMFKKKAWNPLPTGDGQRLSVRVQSNGKYYQSYNFSFSEPWLGGKHPNSLTLGFYRTHLNDLDINNKITGYLHTTSATVEFGKRLKWPDDYFTLVPSINYQLYSLKNYTGTNFLFQNGQSHDINFALDLSRNSIDQQLYPRKGTMISAHMQLTLPYSYIFNSRKLDYTNPELAASTRFQLLEYSKFKFRMEWYAPLSKNNKLVFKASAKMGFLFAYNKDIGVSPFGRFELGGDGISNIRYFGREIISLRGYDVFTPSAGAPIYNKFTMELRYPISLNPSATIYALAFVEGGNWYSSIQTYNPVNLKRSFGAGVRVFLPMFGLLGFDYGIGFDNNNTTGTNFFSKYGKFRIILGFEPE